MKSSESDVLLDLTLVLYNLYNLKDLNSKDFFNNIIDEYKYYFKRYLN